MPSLPRPKWEIPAPPRSTAGMENEGEGTIVSLTAFFLGDDVLPKSCVRHGEDANTRGWLYLQGPLDTLLNFVTVRIWGSMGGYLQLELEEMLVDER